MDIISELSPYIKEPFNLLEMDIRGPHKDILINLVRSNSLSVQEKRTLMLLYYPPTRQFLRALAHALHDINSHSSVIEKNQSNISDSDMSIFNFDFNSDDSLNYSKSHINSPEHMYIKNFPNFRSIKKIFNDLKLYLNNDTNDKTTNKSNSRIKLKIGNKCFSSKYPIAEFAEFNENPPSSFDLIQLRKLGYNLVIIGPNASEEKIKKYLKKKKIETTENYQKMSECKAFFNSKDLPKKTNRYPSLTYNPPSNNKYYLCTKIPSLDAVEIKNFVLRCSGESYENPDVQKKVEQVFKFLDNNQANSNWRTIMNKAGKRPKSVLKDIEEAQSADFTDYKNKLVKDIKINNDILNFFGYETKN